MDQKGMVHALEEIRRLLRHDGTLIDIHPVREAPSIEVHSSARVSFVEPDPGYDDDEEVRHAEDAIARVVKRGLFVVDRSCEFEFVTYGSSVAELRDYMARADAYDEAPRTRSSSHGGRSCTRGSRRS